MIKMENILEREELFKMKLKCENCGHDFLEDVKAYSKIDDIRCPKCKSGVISMTGPGLENG